MGCVLSVDYTRGSGQSARKIKVIAVVENTGEKIYPSGKKIKIKTINKSKKWIMVRHDDTFQLKHKGSCDSTFRLDIDSDNYLILREDSGPNANSFFAIFESEKTGKLLLEHVASEQFVKLDNNGRRQRLCLNDEIYATGIKLLKV